MCLEKMLHDVTCLVFGVLLKHDDSLEHVKPIRNKCPIRHHHEQSFAFDGLGFDHHVQTLPGAAGLRAIRERVIDVFVHLLHEGERQTIQHQRFSIGGRHDVHGADDQRGEKDAHLGKHNTTNAEQLPAARHAMAFFAQGCRRGLARCWPVEHEAAIDDLDLVEDVLCSSERFDCKYVHEDINLHIVHALGSKEVGIVRPCCIDRIREVKEQKPLRFVIDEQVQHLWI
mmetsp:Transcript_8457/g.25072  ORF Transcript_8457/g.25072 Transcript_8457/m.25072 type:complete len:228 (-) Transcript_8457:303-986(-)